MGEGKCVWRGYRASDWGFGIRQLALSWWGDSSQREQCDKSLKVKRDRKAQPGGQHVGQVAVIITLAIHSTLGQREMSLIINKNPCAYLLLPVPYVLPGTSRPPSVPFLARVWEWFYKAKEKLYGMCGGDHFPKLQS